MKKNNLRMIERILEDLASILEDELNDSSTVKAPVAFVAPLPPEVTQENKEGFVAKIDLERQKLSNRLMASGKKEMVDGQLTDVYNI